MLNPVVVADLVDRFRPLSEQEEINAQVMLEDAWELLLLRVPNLEARLTSGELTDGLVRYVMRETIIPVLRNPEGYRQWSVDDASFTRDTTTSTGRLSISDDLIALLLPAAASQGGSFTISPGRSSGSGVEFIDARRTRW